MRIINVLAEPRHYSYAGTNSGGKTLKSGETSNCVDFGVVLNPVFWRDLRCGNIQIRLDPADTKLVDCLLTESERVVVVKSNPKLQKSKPKIAAKKKEGKKEKTEAKPVTPVVVQPGLNSLAALQQLNQEVANPKNVNLKTIEEFMR